MGGVGQVVGGVGQIVGGVGQIVGGVGQVVGGVGQVVGGVGQIVGGVGQIVGGVGQVVGGVGQIVGGVGQIVGGVWQVVGGVGLEEGRKHLIISTSRTGFEWLPSNRAHQRYFTSSCTPCVAHCHGDSDSTVGGIGLIAEAQSELVLLLFHCANTEVKQATAIGVLPPGHDQDLVAPTGQTFHVPGTLTWRGRERLEDQQKSTES